jgi:hypothetical protein
MEENVSTFADTVTVILLISIAVLAVRDYSAGRPTPDEDASAISLADGFARITHDTVGCQDRNAFERLSTLAAARDKIAFTTFAAVHCTPIQAGTKVRLEDRANLSPAFCVRPSGQSYCLWTSAAEIGKLP